MKGLQMALIRTVARRAAGLGVLAAATALLAIPTTSARAADASPLGVWVDNTGRGAVEIKPCGGNSLCGHVVWVRSAKDQSGCGRQIIGAARPIGRGKYQGWIYSPEKGKRFDVEFAPSSGGKLRVTGFAGIRLFSQTMYWTRAADDLVRCGSTQEAKTTTPAPVEVKAKAAPQKLAASAKSETAQAKKQTANTAPSKVSDKSEDATASAPAPSAAPPKKTAAVENSSDIDSAADEQDAPAANSAADDQSTEEDVADGGSDVGGSDLSNLNLGGLKLDKVISRADGKCKLDLPWVKIRFDCKDL
ncbi:MAG: DUF2147 domain-containing protein [Hyphomicrobiaceae bacterium]